MLYCFFYIKVPFYYIVACFMCKCFLSFSDYLLRFDKLNSSLYGCKCLPIYCFYVVINNFTMFICVKCLFIIDSFELGLLIATNESLDCYGFLFIQLCHVKHVHYYRVISQKRNIYIFQKKKSCLQHFCHISGNMQMIFLYLECIFEYLYIGIIYM